MKVYKNKQPWVSNSKYFHKNVHETVTEKKKDKQSA